MSQLAYMTKRGAGVVKMGSARDLGPELEKLQTSATVRSEHGAVIGGSSRCDGACDGDCGGWHWWYDADGDDEVPEPESEPEREDES